MNDLYHYGHKFGDGKMLVKISKLSLPVEVTIPKTDEEVVDLPTALAAILSQKNLMRVSGYFCDNHKKFHRFTFHNQITFTIPFMYGVDTKEEVISFAKKLLNGTFRIRSSKLVD